MNECVKVLNGY